MKHAWCLPLAAACCFAHAAPAAPAPAAPTAAATAAGAPAVTADKPEPIPAAAPSNAAVPDAGAAAASAPGLPGPAAPNAAPSVVPAPLAPSASAGSLLQTILALSFVLALLVGVAWCMKRYGPRAGGANATLRVVGALSLGGRERVLVVEVADQWIVVGAAPGRVNLLTTLPRQDELDTSRQQTSLASNNFSEWLKQTIEKRQGK